MLRRRRAPARRPRLRRLLVLSSLAGGVAAYRGRRIARAEAELSSRPS